MSTTSSSATTTLYVNGRPAQDELARLRTELEAAFHFKRQLPNAIVYASGYVPITKMIKSGAIIDIIGVFCITIPIVLLLVKAVMGV